MYYARVFLFCPDEGLSRPKRCQINSTRIPKGPSSSDTWSGQFIIRECLLRFMQLPDTALVDGRCWSLPPYTGIKAELLKPTALAFYDPIAETKIWANTLIHGVGAVLLLEHKRKWNWFLLYCRP